MKKCLAFVLILLCALFIIAGAQAQERKSSAKESAMSETLPELSAGTYAVFDTTMGRIIARLFTDKAPKTCENFIGLAQGTKAWKEPATGQWVKRPFFDSLIFHRVIPGFMIQGGCPFGMGYGGPGYQFADEFNPQLRHNKPGILSMANSGPNTNGSQFFITEVPTPHLDNHHSVFGEVVDGMDLVKRIARVERDENDKPRTPVIMKTVKIITIEERKRAGTAPSDLLTTPSSPRRPVKESETEFGKPISRHLPLDKQNP